MMPFDSRQQRARLLVAALGVAILFAALPFVTGLLGAAVLFVVFSPLQRWLEQRLSPRSAAAVVVVAATGLLLLPAVWLLAVVIEQAPDTLRSLQRSTFLERVATLTVAGVDVGVHITRASGAVISWLSEQTLHALGSIVRSTLNLVVALFGLYFLLLASDSAWERVKGLLPFTNASAERLRRRFYAVTEATLLGTALTAVLQGTVVGLGFRLTGLPHALFWAAITAVVSVLPVLGSSLVWLPSTLVLMADGRYGAALGMAAIGAVVASNIDNVIRPVINRRVSNLHPMTTLVGAFVGVKWLGLAGVLLGPLAIGYFFELLRIYEAEYGPSRPTLESAGSVAAGAPPPPPVVSTGLSVG